MIVARAIFHAKFGKAKDLVAMFRQMGDEMPDAPGAPVQVRILTDISGTWDTVVLESVHESLAALEQWRSAMFADMDARDDSNPMADLIVSGSNEYWTIEAEM